MDKLLVIGFVERKQASYAKLSGKKTALFA